MQMSLDAQTRERGEFEKQMKMFEMQVWIWYFIDFYANLYKSVEWEHD
jgi:hypothetical protein